VKPTAVDATFLLSLGAGDKATLEANRRLRNSGYRVFCTNSPLIELAACEIQDLGVRDPDLKTSAAKALTDRTRKWGIEDHIIKGVKNGIAQSVAEYLVAKFTWLNLQQGLTVAEAAIAEVDFLITWDSDLIKVDAASLVLLLKECDLSHLTIVSPARVLEVLGR
jgi:hypothetical protein